MKSWPSSRSAAEVPWRPKKWRPRRMILSTEGGRGSVMGGRATPENVRGGAGVGAGGVKSRKRALRSVDWAEFVRGGGRSSEKRSGGLKFGYEFASFVEVLDLLVAAQVLAVDEHVGHGALAGPGQERLLHGRSVGDSVQLDDLHPGAQLRKQLFDGLTEGTVAFGEDDHDVQLVDGLFHSGERRRGGFPDGRADICVGRFRSDATVSDTVNVVDVHGDGAGHKRSALVSKGVTVARQPGVAGCAAKRAACVASVLLGCATGHAAGRGREPGAVSVAVPGRPRSTAAGAAVTVNGFAR
eukprot:ctg_675.g329